MESRKIHIATTNAELRRKVFYFAICSRFFILTLSLTSNALLPDHNAGVYKFPKPAMRTNLLDRVVETILGGLTCWDAQYFLHISHYDYTYENTLAFFPLYPYLTKFLALVLDSVLGSIINQYSTVLISAASLNFLFFVKTSTTLFDLSCKVLRDDKLAYMSAIFFCVNPASIFFTAIYSECCFAFFTFSGMLFSVTRGNGMLTSLALGLSSCIRSNGLVNFGFIVHKSFKAIIYCADVSENILPKVHSFIINLLKLFIYTLTFIMPFVMFQIYIYYKFCFGEVTIPMFLKDFGESNGFLMPGFEKPFWCNFSIPLSYSYVQSHYWDVGFLHYYRLKQIPNFLLAMPVLFLILHNSYLFMLENKCSLVSLGFKKLESVRFQARNLSPKSFVFVIHAVFLSVFCALFVHVQVTTRMLASSSPLLYWIIALRYKTLSSTADKTIRSRLKMISNMQKYSFVETSGNMESVWKVFIMTEKPADSWSMFVQIYFCSYLIVGTILFSNYYPWT